MARAPSLTAMRAFEAVGRLGSLTAAARELFVTPAAVSHRIGDLERQLDTPLFHRQGKRYELTEVGLAGYRVIGDSFQRINLALESMTRQEQRQDINLSAPTSLALLWILPRLARFEEGRRNVTVYLEASDDPLAPREYFPDVIIAQSMQQPDERPWTTLMGNHQIVAAAPSLLRSVGPVKQAADLLGVPLIHSDWRENRRQGGPSWSRWFQAMGVEARRLPGGVHVNQGQLAISLAIAGRGFIVTNVAMAERALLSGELEVVFDQPVLRSTRFWLLVQGAEPENPSVALFRDWLLAEAERTRGLLRGDLAARREISPGA